MNQKARAQVDKIKDNVIRHESREKHKELVSGLCKICKQENLADECPLLEYMMEDVDAEFKTMLEETMMSKLKININKN